MNTTESTPDIDNIDLAIMTLINNADRPLWKNRIHEQLHEKQEELPITSGVSVQTIGRRVDNLQDQGHMETVIASPDDLKRDLIIAFKLTDDGKETLKQKREAILKDIIHNTIFQDKKRSKFGKEALVAMMNDHFPDETASLVAQEYDESELLAVLTLYYAEQEALSVFGKEDKQEFYDTIAEDSVIPLVQKS